MGVDCSEDARGFGSVHVCIRKHAEAGTTDA